MEDCEILIQELITARNKLFCLIDQFDPSLEVYPHWTIKDLLAHLAGWDEVVIETLSAFITGQPSQNPVIHGINAYNTQTTGQRTSIDLESIRFESESKRQQVISLLRLIPPDRLNEDIAYPWHAHGTIAQMMQIFIHHEGVDHYSDMLALYRANHPENLKID